MGTFAFFVRRNGTKAHWHMCLSVRRPTWNWRSVAKAVKRSLFLIEVSICFKIYTKTLLRAIHFQYKLMEHLSLLRLCGLLIISTRVLSENQVLEGGGYLIWFDQILGPHSSDFDQKFFWKVKCPTYARGPPLGLIIDRCIMTSHSLIFSVATFRSSSDLVWSATIRTAFSVATLSNLSAQVCSLSSK